MASNLVIMESPTKALTVRGYLGSNYKVVASVGHVRDLPKSSIGIDIDHNFEAHYINIRGKGDLIAEIRKEAKKANKIFLATDPDREGEAIAWHLSETLDIPLEKTLRVSFNEVTKQTVKAAIKKPRQIDMNLVNAQQTRRILDRIVGYKLSPLLWKNVKNGLSAGRVQSVATKIIVEREEEIRNFVAEEYWSVSAELITADGKAFPVSYYGELNEEGAVKLRVTSKEQAEQIANDILSLPISVKEVKKAVKHKMPAPPFTTSALQQEAFRKLGFPSAKTMKVAQELYEGIHLPDSLGGTQGLITYMRTDSVRVSAEAQQKAREYLTNKYGKEYVPETPRVFKTKATAQDAHEAIRPSHIKIEPSAIQPYATADQYKLYRLIWECFLSSQMEVATLDTLSVDILAGHHLLRSSGYHITFQGYMALYQVTEEENAEDNGVEDIRIPELAENEKLTANSVNPLQHWTEAPVRYNDASLIKVLKDLDIGRPSTYATIITTITQREYVKRDGKSFVPTQLGEVINDLMNKYFAEIMDYGFTADMETSLDKIEEGDADMQKVLSDFWNTFSTQLENAEKKIGNVEVPVEETDIICEKCGAKMIIRNGKFGKFAACPNYPTCKNTKSLVAPTEQVQETSESEKPEETTDEKCEKCGAPLVLRKGRYGDFYACSKYPTCDYTKAKLVETGVPCPKCNGRILTRYGRSKTAFYSCENYPKCDFSTWDLPLNDKCPKCGEMLYKKKSKENPVCKNPNCDYTSNEEKI